MTGWNFADVWEEIAAAAPDRRAQIRGQRVISWRDFDRRANARAAHMLAAGLGHQAKVAAYLYNAPEYLETYYAAFKASLAPVNTNYRYETDELFYLFDNADAEAIIFHAGFAPKLEAIKDRLTKVTCWIAVADEGAPIPAWATEYESIAAVGADKVTAPQGRPVPGARRRRQRAGHDPAAGDAARSRRARAHRPRRGSAPAAADHDDHGLPADARHRPVRQLRRPDRRRLHHHPALTAVQRRGIVRRSRPPAGQQHLHRRSG